MSGWLVSQHLIFNNKIELLLYRNYDVGRFLFYTKQRKKTLSGCFNTVKVWWNNIISQRISKCVLLTAFAGCWLYSDWTHSSMIIYRIRSCLLWQYTYGAHAHYIQQSIYKSKSSVVVRVSLCVMSISFIRWHTLLNKIVHSAHQRPFVSNICGLELKMFWKIRLLNQTMEFSIQSHKIKVVKIYQIWNDEYFNFI